jgi:HK97 family phage prohead protease
MDKPTGREFRVAADTWPTETIELHAEGDGMTFSGYAAVFDKLSEDLGGFREKIAPGAFDATLNQRRAIKMFWNHNQDIALGSSKSNLRLTADATGLRAEAELPDTTAGRDMATLVRNKIVDSMSFGFVATGESWADRSGAPVAPWTQGGIRTLTGIRLYEVSPVTGWPAYPQTSASVRELAEQIEAEPDALAEAFRVLRAEDERLSPDQVALLTSLINARSDRPLRRDFDAAEQTIYAAFRAALN